MSKDGDSVGDVGGSGGWMLCPVGGAGDWFSWDPGVLGVAQRLLELAVELEKDESHEGPQQAPEGEDEG